VDALLIEANSLTVAVLLGLLMAAAMAAGWWLGRRFAQQGQAEPRDKFTDAVLALLGLLLAFTFSMSLAKHDQRRLMLVADSNAIGDFYTSASLLPPPVRGKLQPLLRTYVEHRLRLADGTLSYAEIEARLGECQRMQDQMQGLVDEAVQGGTPVVVPLVNTLNDLTSSHAARLDAGRDRLPGSIVILLVMAAIITSFLEGKQQGFANARDVTSALGFIVLVSLVVWVTLDLNQPRRGLITVNQEPLRQLLKSMEAVRSLE